MSCANCSLESLGWEVHTAETLVNAVVLVARPGRRWESGLPRARRCFLGHSFLRRSCLPATSTSKKLRAGSQIMHLDRILEAGSHLD